jgi:hypothetical protein
MLVVLAFNLLGVLGFERHKGNVVWPLVFVYRVVIKDVGCDSTDVYAVFIKHTIRQVFLSLNHLEEDVSDVEHEVFPEVECLVPVVYRIIVIIQNEDELSILVVIDDRHALEVDEWRLVDYETNALNDEVGIDEGILYCIYAIPEHDGAVVEASLGVQEENLVCKTDEGTLGDVLDEGGVREESVIPQVVV